MAAFSILGASLLPLLASQETILGGCDPSPTPYELAVRWFWFEQLSLCKLA